MLESFARHGFFDLVVEASGDLHIDEHHTVEDVGIVLGRAFRQALGDRTGIRRFGEAMVPLDEALCSAVVDISGRSYLAYNMPIAQERVGDFQTELVHDFMQAFSDEVGMNLEPIRAIRAAVGCLLDVGGGLRTVESVRAAIAAGADYVSIGSAGMLNPPMLAEACREHPGCVFGSLDVREGRLAIKGWRETSP